MNYFRSAYNYCDFISPSLIMITLGSELFVEFGGVKRDKILG